MMLADMGAEVVRLQRLGEASAPGPFEPLHRGKSWLAIDLKAPGASEVVLRMVLQSHALIEGFRPGVAERLGVGPKECLDANPTLIYGRVTGWGQDGPLAGAAGHDINYIALAGVLDLIGPSGEPPVIPLNLLADFGGGGMLLAFGVVCGLLEAQASGVGQVVDAAMVDGAALLSTMTHGLRAQGSWPGERGNNFLDGGAPFYQVYETADGGYVSVGAIEPQFYAELLARLGLGEEELPSQFDPASWSDQRNRLAEVFATRSLVEWQQVLEGTDACFAPVNSAWEAYAHPHLAARETFVEVAGLRQPAPAPRFSRTAVGEPAPAASGRGTGETLALFGFAPEEITELGSRGVIPNP
jgi:alpha-methylacyl-CoA racemase